MTDRFQGDPKLYLTADGLDLNFISGQPVMDAGVENQAVISLFGGNDWWGNSLITDENQRLDSDFEDSLNGPITLKRLSEIEQSAERNLKSPAFAEVSAVVTNPSGWRVDIEATIKPPGSDAQELRLTQNGTNWVNQATDPAYKKG